MGSLGRVPLPQMVHLAGTSITLQVVPFRRDPDRVRGLSRRWKGEPIAMGTPTDT